MTDPELADRTYVEPLSKQYLEEIIAKERPDALLSTVGGQTALNLSIELAEAGILEKYGVAVLFCVPNPLPVPIYPTPDNTIAIGYPESRLPQPLPARRNPVRNGAPHGCQSGRDIQNFHHKFHRRIDDLMDDLEMAE